MKMQLISLTLENFKCHEHLAIRFDGRNASIFGANGTGKSSVYDAFTWLLFGKDSKGSAKSEALKPIVQEGEHMGEVKDSGAITSVEAVLLVDGMERKLKRTYYELWSTKRGSAEKTRDGHSSDYFVDDVPCKKNEFARRVKAGEALTPEELSERDALRKEYIASVKASLTAHLDNTYLLEPDGTKRRLQKKTDLIELLFLLSI